MHSADNTIRNWQSLCFVETFYLVWPTTATTKQKQLNSAIRRTVLLRCEDKIIVAGTTNKVQRMTKREQQHASQVLTHANCICTKHNFAVANWLRICWFYVFFVFAARSGWQPNERQEDETIWCSYGCTCAGQDSFESCLESLGAINKTGNAHWQNNKIRHEERKKQTD